MYAPLDCLVANITGNTQFSPPSRASADNPHVSSLDPTALGNLLSEEHQQSRQTTPNNGPQPDDGTNLSPSDLPISNDDSTPNNANAQQLTTPNDRRSPILADTHTQGEPPSDLSPLNDSTLRSSEALARPGSNDDDQQLALDASNENIHPLPQLVSETRSSNSQQLNGDSTRPLSGPKRAAENNDRSDKQSKLLRREPPSHHQLPSPTQIGPGDGEVVPEQGQRDSPLAEGTQGGGAVGEGYRVGGAQQEAPQQQGGPTSNCAPIQENFNPLSSFFHTRNQQPREPHPPQSTPPAQPYPQQPHGEFFHATNHANPPPQGNRSFQATNTADTPPQSYPPPPCIGSFQADTRPPNLNYLAQSHPPQSYYLQQGSRSFQAAHTDPPPQIYPSPPYDGFFEAANHPLQSSPPLQTRSSDYIQIPSRQHSPNVCNDQLSWLSPPNSSTPQSEPSSSRNLGAPILPPPTRTSMQHTMSSQQWQARVPSSGNGQNINDRPRFQGPPYNMYYETPRNSEKTLIEC